MIAQTGDSEFRRSGPQRFVFAVILLVIVASGVSVGAEAAGPNRVGDFSDEVVSADPATPGPVEIHSGFVIGDSGYIPPPYVVRSVDETVYVNDQAILILFWRRGFRRPPSERRDSAPGGEDSAPGDSQGDGPRDPEGSPPREDRRESRMGPPRGMPMTWQVAQIEQHLRAGGMLICLKSIPVSRIPLRQAVAILDILISRRPADVKIQDLMDMNVPWMASEQWGAVVKSFAPSEELLLRFEKVRDLQAKEESQRIEAEHRFLRLHSIVTILGFFLAVWAFGSLFACRSPVPEGMAGSGSSGVSPRQVVRLIVLIAILSAYDLLCTLLADGIGGLWELNPLAGSLLSSRTSIVLFKVMLTGGACTLLVYARHHRLAQLAAWWSGVLYTLLILRWATFNSVFLPG